MGHCSRSVEVFHGVYWSHHTFLMLVGTPATSEQHVNTLSSSLTLPQQLYNFRAGSSWPAFPQQHLLAFWPHPFICCCSWETSLQMKISLKSRRLDTFLWIPALLSSDLWYCFWGTDIGTSLWFCPYTLTKPIVVLFSSGTASKLIRIRTVRSCLEEYRLRPSTVEALHFHRCNSPHCVLQYFLKIL